jgi:large subunit ribosomal protein L18
MGNTAEKTVARRRRHARLRKKVRGTAECGRLAVFRSLKHTYAQVIDDEAGHTLVAASTAEKSLIEGLSTTADVEAAKAVGKAIGERALAKGITKVVFDRGGFLYHGRVKAVAEAAREAGLQF